MPIRILNPDGLYPKCWVEGCGNLATAGYCNATCCVRDNDRPAYCSEHSHAPVEVLEVLGHSPWKMQYGVGEVLDIVRAMWAGAGLVLENAGKFQMERDIARERARRAAIAEQENNRPVAEDPPRE